MLEFTDMMIYRWPSTRKITFNPLILRYITLTELHSLLGGEEIDKDYEMLNENIDIKLVRVFHDDSIWLIKVRETGVTRYVIELGSTI